VEQSVIFVLPPSWSIVDLPKNSEFTFGPAKAVFTYTLKGGVLHLYRSIELPRTLVLPEEREAFSAFLDAVGAKARQPVLLRRGS